jgi:hypothetical protein
MTRGPFSVVRAGGMKWDMIIGRVHHTLYTSTGSITRRIPENMRGTSEHHLGSRVVMGCAHRLFYARAHAWSRVEKAEGKAMTGTEFYRTLRGIRMGLFKPGFLKGPIANKPYDQCNVVVGPYRCVEDFGHQGECETIRVEMEDFGRVREIKFEMGDFTVERWPDIRVRYERERHKRGENRIVVLWDTGNDSFSDNC